VADPARLLADPSSRAAGRETLSLRSVSKSYRDGTETVWACRQVDLSVGKGELALVRGPSGAGKSTLLLAGAGLIEPDEGVVSIGGTVVSARTRLERVGVVFQDHLLIDEYTAEENVMLPLEARGWTTARARTEAGDWIVAAGLGGLALARRRPAELSGGQRQRVAIARALAGDKTVILADEPTGSLDSRSSAEVFALLRELADGGVAVLVASHDPECARFADQTYDMRDGVLTPRSDGR
jgi:ABC-type lipoprotein export system ATPase subunit